MKNLYGTETKKALKNFPFSSGLVAKELIYAIVEVKLAAAIANYKTQKIDKKTKDSITKTCKQILSGKHDNNFPLPYLQGGGGTSINMNVNEVIANLSHTHPLDHVNLSQSTNDVVPSALKITAIRLTNSLLKSIDSTIKAFEKKAAEFKAIPKLGRTHLQDAVPTTLGAEFRSWAETLQRDEVRIRNVFPHFHELNLGGTAIGNSINASNKFRKALYQELIKIIGIPVKPAKNLMSSTSSHTDFLMLSQTLVALTLDLSKIANDIKLLASGPKGGLGEITLPKLQSGSTIMPGKVNPILPETVNQLYFIVSGNNLSIEQAVHASQLELGTMTPIISEKLIESLKLSSEVIANFARNCVLKIKANPRRCRENLENSTAYATLLTPALGYDKVASLVKEALKKDIPLRKLVIDRGLMTESKFNKIITTLVPERKAR